MDLLPAETARFLRATAPEPDALGVEMDEYAEEQGFPHVGPEVGATLRILARMVDARRVFEFGSGFGYSAYWWGQALPSDGELVLTEFDADELDEARSFMERAGLDGVARYEHGDALDAIERYDGPFDCVLVDHQKHRYREAFDAVREKVAPGGVVVADNAMTAGIIEFEKLLAGMEGDLPADANEHTAGIHDYLTTVRADEAFETVVLPLGEGIAVSYRVE